MSFIERGYVPKDENEPARGRKRRYAHLKGMRQTVTGEAKSGYPRRARPKK